MTSEVVLDTIEMLGKPGINYVCAGCGTLLYHNGVDGAFEGGELGFSSRQPREVADRLISCPVCARKLNPNPDPDTITVKTKSKSATFRPS